MSFSFVSAHRRSRQNTLCLFQAQSLNSVLPFLQRFPHVTSVFRHVCPRICGFCAFVASGDATSQMGFRRRISPKCCGGSCCEVTPTVSAVASSQRNTSAVDHQVPAAKKGKGKGFGPAKAKVPTSSTMQRDSQLQFEKTRSNVSRPSCRGSPDPESPNSSNCSPRWAKRTTCALPSRKHSRRPSAKHENNLCASASGRPKGFVERKQKRVEQAQEALNLAMASQEEEKLLAEGERRFAELMMEEKTVPSPFQAKSSLQRQRGVGSLEGRDL